MACLLLRALLHFLDSEKFNNKDQFTEHYKKLSLFDEKEVCVHVVLKVMSHEVYSCPVIHILDISSSFSLCILHMSPR